MYRSVWLNWVGSLRGRVVDIDMIWFHIIWYGLDMVQIMNTWRIIHKMLSSTMLSFPKFHQLFLFPRNPSKFHPRSWIFHQSIWLAAEILSKNHEGLVRTLFHESLAILLDQSQAQMEAVFHDCCTNFHIHFYLIQKKVRWNRA